MIPFAKHIHVLHLLSTLPRPIEVDRYVRKSPVTPQQAVDAWDHMFTYIHANWEIPESYITGWVDKVPTDVRNEVHAAVKECDSLLMMPKEEFVAKLASLPTFFSEYCFPIAVARFMLRDAGIYLNHRAKTFTEFHNRYGYIILADY